MVRISVIIPSYNRATVVHQAIESVLAQSCRPNEVIVVDDGSSDGTLEVLNKYRNEIVIVRQTNQGASAARNAGLAIATGDWISFLDSDDIWYPNRIAILLRDIHATEAGVHVANSILEGPDSEIELFRLRGIKGPAEQAIMVDSGFEWASGLQLGSVGIRRDWLTRVGGFDSSMSIYEDVHLLYRLSVLGPWQFTAEIVARVRRIAGDKGALSRKAIANRDYSARMYAKIFEDLRAVSELNPSQRIAACRHLSGALLKLAYTKACAGNSTEAKQALFRSAREHPSFKGWIKIVPPLLLGRIGYEAILGVRRGFYRD